MGRLAELLSVAVRSYWMPGMPSRDPSLSRAFGYGPTASGVTVNETTAMTFSAFWAAVNLIASGVASLPLHLYKRLPDGSRQQFTTHRLYRVLHHDFNPGESSVDARQRMQGHVLVWGNAYAEIQRTNGGEIAGLWPITPDRVTPDLHTPDGPAIYRVQQANGRDVILAAEDVLHIKGLGFDGLRGYSVVQMFRETIGLGLATRQYGAQFFGNGAVSSLVAQHPSRISDGAHERLRSSIADKISGEKKHSVLVLEEGIKVEKISIPPDDAQFLDTQRFSVAEIARIFNIPPHMLGDVERSTSWGTGIEQQAVGFVRYCLDLWLKKWQEEYRRKLIRPLEHGQQFVEHDVNGLLHADPKERFERHVKMHLGGLTTANRVAALENWEPFGPSGDMRLVPSNMVPADRVNDVIDAQTRPPEPPAAPAAPEDPTDDEPDTDPERVLKIAEDLRQEVRGGFTGTAEAMKEFVAGIESALAEGRAQIVERIKAIPAPDPAPILAAVEGLETRLGADVAGIRDDVNAARAESVEHHTTTTEQLAALPVPEHGIAAAVATSEQHIRDAIIEVQAHVRAAREEVQSVGADASASHETLSTVAGIVDEIHAAGPSVIEAIAERVGQHVDEAVDTAVGVAKVARDSTLAVVASTGEEIKARLATDAELRRVQRAAVAIATVGLVRREIANVKKLAKDPTRAEGLTEFYERIRDDGVENLAPLGAEDAVRARLDQWAEGAMRECAAAITEGTIGDLATRWIGRHEAMTNGLMEAINGHA